MQFRKITALFLRLPMMAQRAPVPFELSSYPFSHCWAFPVPAVRNGAAGSCLRVIFASLRTLKRYCIIMLVSP